MADRETVDFTDSYGVKKRHVTECGERQTCAYVSRRHGAYLISVSGDRTDSATPEECYDAASSMKVARQLARDMADSFGYVGPYRWTEHSSGLLEMEGRNPDEYDEFVDDDEPPVD